MVLDNLQSMDALFGMTQTGGKPKTRKTAKTGKTVKTVKKAVKAGTKKAVKGGEVWDENDNKDYGSLIEKYNSGELDELEKSQLNALQEKYNRLFNKQSSTEVPGVKSNITYKCNCNQEGGMSKMQYKAYLAKMDVKRLYKIAKGKGIKITKKKDGKTTYIKKDTVIQKLCDALHGKKK